jgi:zinc transporter ZupT
MNQELYFFANIVVGLAVGLTLSSFGSHLQRRRMISPRIVYFGIHPVSGGIIAFFIFRGSWVDRPMYVYLAMTLGVIVFAEVMVLLIRQALHPPEAEHKCD